jgi:hypothetical protein
MKKIVKNKNLLFILPLLLAGLIFSCQNELTDIWKGKDKEWNATIERAKVIFSEYSPDFPCIQTRGLPDIRKSIVFEPVWDEAFIARHDDGSLTVEAHIRLSKPLVVVPSESFEAYQSTKDVRYLQYLSRAVVLIKENSIPQAFLMTIVGSKDYMEAHDFQLWDVCYKNIPEDFSGMILYHTLSGEFVNGWCVEEGWNFNTCNPISEEDAELFSRSGTNCYIEQVTTYYVDCQDYAGYNYTFYEDELYIYPWSYSTCGTPYPVIEYYQVCDEDTEDDSGSSGGGITGGGGSSTTGGGSVSMAKAMFRNSNMTDENWNVIENMLKKITEDCMGQNLYNALLEKLDGKQLIIQFSDKSSSFDFEFGNGININIDYIESNHLFHEMWHAYQAYQETVDSYKEALLNLEIEAHYAQYLYLKKLPEYANGKWIRTYIKDPRHWQISEFDLYLEANDEFNFYIEDSVLKILLQDIIDVFHGIEEYKNYKFDYNRMNLSTLRNLNVLTKGC